MKKTTVFKMPSLHRDPMCITSFVFGDGEKNTVIVGPTRGNEIQQLYTASRLVKTLKRLEDEGKFVKGKSVEVIPVLNPSSINVGRRFWAMDGTDINRMFPGYNLGETTQRIAAGIFERVQGYKNGIQLASYYLRGEFVTHVRMMQTPYQDVSAADAFGFPFVVRRKPRPMDTTTLNYNWQIWNTRAFSIISQASDAIDPESAKESIAGILRFLVSEGVVKTNVHPGWMPRHFEEESLSQVRSPQAGLFEAYAGPGDFVEKKAVLGVIIDPLTGEILREVKSRIAGTIFFAYREPLVMEGQLLFRIIKNLGGV